MQHRNQTHQDRDKRRKEEKSRDKSQTIKFIGDKKSVSAPSAPALPFKAITLEAGFMMAESAEMGRRMGLVGSCMSMITTCAVSATFSRTQMNLSLSIVSVLKLTLAWLIPMLVNCNHKFQ
jgi:hypothetical protein